MNPWLWGKIMTFNVMMNGNVVNLSDLIGQINQEIFALQLEGELKVQKHLRELEIRSRIIGKIVLPDEISIKEPLIWGAIDLFAQGWAEKNLQWGTFHHMVDLLRMILGIKPKIWEESLLDYVQERFDRPCEWRLKASYITGVRLLYHKINRGWKPKILVK